MSIQVKLFGMLANAAKKNEILIQDVNDTNSLRQKMFSEFPKLKNYSFIIAVHNQIANGNQKLQAGDVVALLPPFAGG